MSGPDAQDFGAVDSPQGNGGSRRPFSGNSASRSPASADAREILQRRVPPHSEAAEQAVLSGILLRPEVIHEVIDQVSESDFYIPANRNIFRAVSALYSTNAPIDQLTVFDWLSSHSLLTASGGAEYLAELCQGFVSGANAAYYAKLVKGKAMQRDLISVCAQIISNCYDTASDVSELLDDSEKKVFSIAERANNKTYSPASEVVSSVYKQLSDRYQNKNPTTGIPSGYMNLDRMTAGFQPTDLIILAARPSMGKTALALNIVMRSSLSAGASVAIFSLEMSKESLIERMLCAWGRIPLSNVRRGFLDDVQWSKLSETADVFSRAKILIDDTPALTPLALRARCRRMKAEYNIDMVVIDYLQLMHSSRNDSRELEISDISRNLKALAKELKIPVIALSQLNRKVEERNDKRPVLSDLRESGAIEQDADVIMFIHREDAYIKKADQPKTGIAEIIIGKHRNGPTGTVQLVYHPEYTAFDELEGRYIEPSESEPTQ